MHPHRRRTGFSTALGAFAMFALPATAGPPAACPNPSHGCCTGGSPGCSDEACCKAVCAVDPFCCETLWDNLCVAQAQKLCPGVCVAPCPNPKHDCCTEGSAGCADLACCEAVCAIDPFCCDYFWDSGCIDFADSTCSASCLTCHGDLSGDGAVAVLDLLIIIAEWGPCEACPADLNDDGVVDVLDLLEVINVWGPCP